MRINNKEYIKLKIENSLYYYILKDYNSLKNLIDNKKIIIDIYKEFIKFLEKEYKVNIDNIELFKEDYIYYEIDNNILEYILEDNIY